MTVAFRRREVSQVTSRELGLEAQEQRVGLHPDQFSPLFQ